MRTPSVQVPMRGACARTMSTLCWVDPTQATRGVYLLCTQVVTRLSRRTAICSSRAARRRQRQQRRVRAGRHVGGCSSCEGDTAPVAAVLVGCCTATGWWECERRGLSARLLQTGNGPDYVPRLVHVRRPGAGSRLCLLDVHAAPTAARQHVQRVLLILVKELLERLGTARRAHCPESVVLLAGWLSALDAGVLGVQVCCRWTGHHRVLSVAGCVDGEYNASIRA